MVAVASRAADGHLAFRFITGEGIGADRAQQRTSERAGAGAGPLGGPDDLVDSGRGSVDLAGLVDDDVVVVLLVRELEGVPAMSLLATSLPGGRASVHHLTVRDTGGGPAVEVPAGLAPSAGE